jgi:hypothetical protein
MMDDMVKAMQVTINCIKDVGNDAPITLDKKLVILGIDNGAGIRNLKRKIATSDEIGLPSLNPKYKIDQNIMDINETSTVQKVFRTVFRNAVIDN